MFKFETRNALPFFGYLSSLISLLDVVALSFTADEYCGIHRVCHQDTESLFSQIETKNQ